MGLFFWAIMALDKYLNRPQGVKVTFRNAAKGYEKQTMTITALNGNLKCIDSKEFHRLEPLDINSEAEAYEYGIKYLAGEWVEFWESGFRQNKF